MEATISGNVISISASGIELLKLKAAIAKRIGDAAQISRGTVSFPVSCIDIVVQEIPELKELFPAHCEKLKLHGEARQTAITSVSEGCNHDIPVKWNTILDIPQQHAVNAMITPNLLGLCLFDEQGSGKTVMTIAAFDILKQRNDIDAMIVVCPKSMLTGWEQDIKKFLVDRYKTVLAQGTRAKKRNTALAGFDVLISNYEGLDAMSVVLTAMATNTRFLLVVDESYYAKNEKSERSSHITQVRASCARCFVLCGTPAPNSPYDLINQFNIADGGYTFSSFIGTNDLDADKEAIATIIADRGTYIRRLKDEILSSVPEKSFHVIPVKLAGRQKELYERAKHDLILELRAYDNTKFKKNLATYFQRRNVLLQICSVPSNIDPAFLDVPAKYERLDELLEELFEKKRKVIIWTFYKSSVAELIARYEKYAPLVIDGNTSTSTRKEAVDAFQNDPSRMLFIANPAAAGAGITLHAAYDAIYISYTNQAAHYLQSLDRIHRRGQISDIVNYYLLVCEKTIEESEIERLRSKEIQQHNLLGDSIVWPTSLDDALAELTSGDDSI